MRIGERLVEAVRHCGSFLSSDWKYGRIYNQDETALAVPIVRTELLSVP
jgi:hypothetical protein